MLHPGPPHKLPPNREKRMQQGKPPASTGEQRQRDRRIGLSEIAKQRGKALAIRQLKRGKMIAVCSVCGSVRLANSNFYAVGVGPREWEKIAREETGEARVSHGYCRRCADEAFAELDKLKKSKK